MKIVLCTVLNRIVTDKSLAKGFAVVTNIDLLKKTHT